MSVLKLVDVVRRFNGDATDDLEKWLDRFKVAMDVTGSYKSDSERDKAMAKVMPLFLDGSAYSTWKQLTDSQKEDLDEVRSALRRVYGLSKISAWNKIKNKRIYPGEAVDVVADELRDLLRIVIEDEPPDRLVAVTLIDTLPQRIAEQVTLLYGEKMELRDVLSCAKSLQVSAQGHDSMTTAAAGTLPGQPSIESRGPLPQSPRCLCCRRLGHQRNECHIICFRCGQRGHFQRTCKSKKEHQYQPQGNEQAGAVFPDRIAPADDSH